MTTTIPREDSLVLYKNQPARVLSVTDKLELAFGDGRTRRVRPKDIVLLHRGPLRSLEELAPVEGETEAAWELLAGESTTLEELTELVFGQHTPATAWAAWGLVAEGIYFQGTPEAIHVRGRDEVAREEAARLARARAAQAWDEFLERVRKGRVLPEDAVHLVDVESLADGRNQHSRVLRELGHRETPEAAHRLLLKLGHWDGGVNPHARRYGLTLRPPVLAVPGLPDEDRLDLTHLQAFAIDDEGNQDPDDAISADGGRLWVHVADVAALATPDSDLDLEARARGASLYLPERLVPMLPEAATAVLGLGLQAVSPALSFELAVDADGVVSLARVAPSMVRVSRLSYQEAELRLHDAPFKDLLAMASRFAARRAARGSVRIELPEVKLRVVDGAVSIQALPRLRSRELVTEAMLMAGEAVAGFAIERGIPIPFSTQAAPENASRPVGMAAMFAYRRSLKRSQIKVSAEPHAGLGLAAYSQVTSPLRRYPDLLAHQQLRAWARGGEFIGVPEVVERIGMVDGVIGTIRRTERQSNRHWTLVHLSRNEGWTGEGILVEKRGRAGRVLIPELGLDVGVQLRADSDLDMAIALALTGVDLPELAIHLQAR